MELALIQNILLKIEGCTFATIDSTTEPSKGLTKITTGERVILFTNKNSSGYENMVKRRLVEAGKNPDNFVLGDPAWGERIPNSPLIKYKDNYYLQCIELARGQSKYFIGSREVSPEGLMLKEHHSASQGLAKSDEVVVKQYKLSSINRIALMGVILGDVVATSKGITPVTQ